MSYFSNAFPFLQESERPFRQFNITWKNFFSKNPLNFKMDFYPGYLKWIIGVFEVGMENLVFDDMAFSNPRF